MKGRDCPYTAKELKIHYRIYIQPVGGRNHTKAAPGLWLGPTFQSAAGRDSANDCSPTA